VLDGVLWWKAYIYWNGWKIVGQGLCRQEMSPQAGVPWDKGAVNATKLSACRMVTSLYQKLPKKLCLDRVWHDKKMARQRAGSEYPFCAVAVNNDPCGANGASNEQPP